MTDIEKRQKKIADVTEYTQEQVAIIKQTVAKNTTDSELALFLFTAREMKLSPLSRQIWCYKDLKNNLIVFAGRDGFLACAQRDNRWNGIASSEVREGEIFELNIAQGTISHIKDVTSKKPIVGAYAICRPKGVEIPTIEWADFDTYNKNVNVWKADPAAMIKKVAEVHALKKAYGISGLQAEEDFDTTNGRAVIIDHEMEPDTKSIGYADELIRNCTGDEDYKQIMEDKLKDPEITITELDNIIHELQMNQPKLFK